MIGPLHVDILWERFRSLQASAVSDIGLDCQRHKALWELVMLLSRQTPPCGRQVKQESVTWGFCRPAHIKLSRVSTSGKSCV